MYESYVMKSTAVIIQFLQNKNMSLIPIPFDVKAEFGQSRAPVKVPLNGLCIETQSLLWAKSVFGQTLFIGLIRFLLPPHADNENAAQYLQSRFGNNHHMIE